jgi:diketogulonate reductase-like aldo/keto reductase
LSPKGKDYKLTGTSQKIMACKIGYSRVHKVKAYQEEKQAGTIIKAFSYDMSDEKFLILTKNSERADKKDKEFKKIGYRLKIFDIK